MSMGLNANKSALAGHEAADEKSDQVEGEARTPREAAVYALTPRTDISSLSALKESLHRAATEARVAVAAVEQIGASLKQVREKAADGPATSTKMSEEDHQALMRAIEKIEDLAALDSGEGSFGLAARDFTLGGPILDLGDGTRAALDLAINRAASALAEMDAEAAQIEKHVALVARLQDMLAKRVGGLVDADLDQEAARLQALQIQQQLGAHALSLANSQPQAVLELFRGD